MADDYQTLEEWFEAVDVSEESEESTVEGEKEFPDGDIALVVRQANVPRRVAVEALQRNHGDLVDAILELVE